MFNWNIPLLKKSEKKIETILQRTSYIENRLRKFVIRYGKDIKDIDCDDYSVSLQPDPYDRVLDSLENIEEVIYLLGRILEEKSPKFVIE